MDNEKQIQELEIVLNWLDSKGYALEQEMNATPLGDRFAELMQQSTVLNHLYDVAMAEYHAALDAKLMRAQKALASWIATVSS